MAFPKTVSVTWVDPNPAGVATEYRVSRNGTQVAAVGVPQFSEQLTGPGTYTYSIVAANSQEVSPAASGLLVASPVLLAVQSINISLT